MGHGVENNGFLIIDIHAAQQIDDVHEGIEIHLYVVINGYADKVRNSLHGQSRTAAGQLGSSSQCPGGVDAAVAEAGDIHPHITRDGKHPRRFCGWIHGQYDQRIRAKRAIPLEGIAPAQPYKQDIDAAASIPGGILEILRRQKLRGRGWLWSVSTIEDSRDFKGLDCFARATGRRNPGQRGESPAGCELAHKKEEANRAEQNEAPENYLADGESLEVNFRHLMFFGKGRLLFHKVRA